MHIHDITIPLPRHARGGGPWNRLAAVSLLLVVTVAHHAPPAIGEQFAPSETASQFLPVDRAKLEAYLAEREDDYSQSNYMLGLVFSGPGYHTKIPNGTWAHPTRQSLDYAIALFERGKPSDEERARRIVAKVLTLQVTDPDHPYYGIWPWLLEESVDEMDPPDRNWADFCGARLLQILHDYEDALTEPLRSDMLDALRHAAHAIRKRDVGPGYTNIAIMGGGVTAAAGEVLDDDELVEYGRKRLERVVHYVQDNGGFNEYNSPTYTRVSLQEADRTLYLVRDQRVRVAAQMLHRFAWQTIADSFHPATRQWAGPHSRAYSDRLPAATLGFLSRATGHNLLDGTVHSDDDVPLWLAPELPCPAHVRSRFLSLPSDPLELHRTFHRANSPRSSTIGITWFDQAVCLGSINHASFWTQRRPIIGYWKLDEPPCAVFRVRFLHDGKDFASMGVRTAQQGRRLLLACYPLRNKGDWHVSLDRPADGIFTARDFRLRFELQGQGASVERLREGVYALVAGDHRAVVHVARSRLAGSLAQLHTAEEDNFAALDVVGYEGPPRDFNFKTLRDVSIAAGVELLETNQTTTTSEVSASTSQSGKTTATWPLADDHTLAVQAVPEG